MQELSNDLPKPFMLTGWSGLDRQEHLRRGGFFLSLKPTPYYRFSFRLTNAEAPGLVHRLPRNPKLFHRLVQVRHSGMRLAGS